MDEREFSRWAGLLEARAGVRIAPERRSYVETRVTQRAEESGFADLAEYFQFLQTRAGLPEWHTLVDRLTVHQTRFFRHPSSMRLVNERIVPEWLARARWGGTFRAWSVGCATGEETYSLAMVLDRALRRDGARVYLAAYGTDISRRALAAAQAGRYAEAQLREVPAELLGYFQPAEAGRVVVAEALRRRVCFSAHNLREHTQGPAGPDRFDLVFCQNVLIYFDAAQRAAVVTRLAEAVAPGGYLVLGPGELLSWTHPAFERVTHPDTLAFQRRTEAPAEKAR